MSPRLIAEAHRSYQYCAILAVLACASSSEKRYCGTSSKRSKYLGPFATNVTPYTTFSMPCCSISSELMPRAFRELCAEVGDGLTGRRRRIVGVFEPPLLQQRSDTPCPMLTWSSCFSQGRSPTRSPRCCATERAPYWPKRLRPRWRDSSPSMSI